ncbi:MAG: efflux transporter outer membrane subunit [Alistipes sp.]|nr:efflux transporter outer membrane subunit [Alistipes sp.]
MKRIFMLGACIALLAACTPTLYEADVKVPDDYLFAGEFPRDSARLPLDWWELFGDTTLNRLEEHALGNNRNLAAAVSRVLEARAAQATARAPYLPSLGATVTAGASYTEAGGTRQNYGIEPSVSWEVPLFGTLRNADREAKAALYASEWGYRGVMLALTADVATTYFTLLRYTRDLQIARQSYALRLESAALVDSLNRYGMADGVALEQARSLVYQAEADIPQYRRAVEQSRLALCVLLGEAPSRFDGLVFDDTLLEEERHPEIPVGLPSELLERRPDVMEAAYEMERAAAGVGLARSKRFPSITLTASGGAVSSSLAGIADGSGWVWSAAGSLLQPIFSFGKLRRQEEIARERYYQSMFAYEETALEAFADVEKALLDVATYRTQRANYARLLQANTEIATMTRALYRSGMSAYLDVIDAERNMYQSQMEYVNLAAQQYISYVALFKALGGGW